MFISIAAVLLLLVAAAIASCRRRKPKCKIIGSVSQRFSIVRDELQWLYDSGLLGDSGLCVFHEGQLVAELYSGAWQPQSLGNVYTGGHAIASLCFCRLAHDGQLQFQRQVSSYWPEFSANGKALVTVQQLLEHKAGLSGLDEPLLPADLLDQSALSSRLANQQPLWDPSRGKVVQFHYCTFQLYADQLMRRADAKRRSLAEFVHQELCEPHNLDIRVGAEPSCARRMMWPRICWRLSLTCGWRNLLSLLLNLLWPNSVRRRTVSTGRQILGRCDLPLVGAGTVGTVRSFAELWSLVADGQIPTACHTQAAFHLPQPIRGAEGGRGGRVVGGVGDGGQVMWCDIDRRLSLAFCTNWLSVNCASDDSRALAIVRAVYRCLR